ncbi:MAG: hypothetical protein QOJ80_3461, partial [Mycobacterium sp.]|nr:hypothetical protein [Mycobacterium sp.]
MTGRSVERYVSRHALVVLGQVVDADAESRGQLVKDGSPAVGEDAGRRGQGGELRGLAESQDLVDRPTVGVGRVVEHLGNADSVDVSGDSRQCKRQNV